MTKDGLLTQYVEAGFPYLRQVVGLPDGLLPDFVVVVRQLSDEGMFKLVEPLGLAEKIKDLLDRAPDPDSLPAEKWRQSVANWQSVHQVLSVTMALLRACEKVDAMEREGALDIDSVLVRGLAATAYAPFAPNGSELLSNLADILGGTVMEPAGLLDRYITVVATGDSEALAGIHRCILGNPAWREWSERLLATGKEFPFLPKVVGISPPLVGGLKQVLVNMLMEAFNAHSSRNYPD